MNDFLKESFCVTQYTSVLVGYLQLVLQWRQQ
jgi:hypothetical protein